MVRKATSKKQLKDKEGLEGLENKDNTLVFISHDSRDAEIAEAFSKLLGSVTAGVLKSFRSSDNKGNQGIEYGVEWYPKILDALQNASDVVCLLTKNSTNRPWILFEAGMAKGKLDTSILGIAIGVPLASISNGPFAQFQNCADDADSLTKLVKQLVKKIPNSEPDEEVIKSQVEIFKKRINTILQSTIEEKKIEKKETKLDFEASAKLFEEVKIMFQELPKRVERLSIKNIPSRKMMHPHYIEEMMHFPMEIDSKIRLLMLLAPIRNEYPWVYDSAIDIYDKLEKARSRETAERQIKKFMDIVELSFNHPMLRDIVEDNEYLYRYCRELPRAVYEILTSIRKRENYLM